MWASCGVAVMVGLLAVSGCDGPGLPGMPSHT